MTDLPKGWALAAVDQITARERHALAIGPFGSNLKVSDYRSSGVPLIFVRNIRAHAFELADLRFVSPEKAESLRAHQVRHGDLLITKMGDPPGDAAIYPRTESGIITADCIKLTPDPLIDARYLMYAFGSPQIKRQIGDITQGVAQRKVSLDRFRKGISLPLAPLEERKRIVAAIEEQFSCLDAGVAALCSAQKRANSVKKAILLAAIPEVWPARWRKVTIAEAGEVTLGRQRAPQYHNGPKMHPYLRVANVFEDRIDSGDVMSMHFDDEEFERFRLRPEDILLNEGQSPHLLGRPAMYRGDPSNVAFTNSLLRFRAGSDVLPAWALLVFRRHMHAKRFMDESQITTNIAHLSAGRFKKVEFPIPPMDEQKMIVASIEEELSEVSRMEAMVNTQLARADRLRSSILAAAFSGQLVSRDKAAA